MLLDFFWRTTYTSTSYAGSFEKKLMGSYVGSLGDMQELMELVVAGKIDPVDVEMRDVSEANRTLEEMKEGKLLGLVALTHD